MAFRVGSCSNVMARVRGMVALWVMQALGGGFVGKFAIFRGGNRYREAGTIVVTALSKDSI